eukprot:TRINITY_DN3853_c0_g1_i2.p1 TRINITY_DN3853_c0_g1~~TRINITY_DN3853_c0_g1_i2.p1  ORF type:complete len:349 (+),score=69.73 TRINITY_DN3853_c0_g1_i2:109-1155(+)
MTKKILVSGAGIAGPTVAYWLTQYGMNVTIVERSPEMRNSGQNVDIRGAGIEVMRKMGAEEAVRNSLTKEEGVHFRDDYQIQASFPATSFDGKGPVAELEILRGELARVLVEHTRDKVEYIFGDYITAVEELGDRVRVGFSKGAEREFDMLIIADGQNSRTRTLVFGEEAVSITHLNEYIAFFSIPYEETDDTWSTWYNAVGGRMAWLRPDGQRKSARAHLAVISEPKGYDRLSVEEQKAKLAEIFGDAGWETPRMLEGMKETKDFYLAEVIQVKMDKWSKGRVVLLGDAGYCASPISGMGTSLALVGAYILAGEIASHENVTEAFESYETLLRPYVSKAQKNYPRWT